MANINFKLGFDLDKKGIEQAKAQLNQLMQTIKGDDKFHLDKDLQKAYKSAELLDKALKKAYSTNLDKLNVKEFTNELRKGSRSLSTIERDLNSVGVRGAQAFGAIEHEINKVGLQVRQTSKFLNNMFDTIGKTVKWGIASSMMNQMTGSVQRAIGFTKALDESLNNIRVVSGKNAAQMKEFANEANEAAKALGKTTTEYTDASLIFFQQGKTAAEVRSLTEATLLGANVTGTEVSEMANLLTAAMNGYNMEASRALEVTDKLAAVGAATGSDFEELATGMSKVASMANIAGVDIDKLNAMLATTTTVTREAPESIGTSYKTIFGRIAEVKAGKEDEEGWDLGKVEDTFKKASMSVLDAQGKMKDVGVIIEEVGGKWSAFNRETKMALANAMAGQRQANRLIALFENWDMYLDTVKVSQESLGATMEQNAVREDSLAYQTKQLTANLESLWRNIFNEDSLKTGTSLLNGAIDLVNTFIESLGGIGNALTVIGGIAASVFSKQITGTITSSMGRIGNFREDLRKRKEVGSRTADSSVEGRADREGEPISMARSYELAQQQKSREMADAELKIKKSLSAEEHNRYKTLTAIVNKESEARTQAQKRLAIAQDIVAQAGLENQEITKKSIAGTKQGVQREMKELEALKRSADSLKLTDQQRVISQEQIRSKIQQTSTEQNKQNALSKSILADLKVSGKGNIEIEQIQKRITQEYQRRVEQLQVINRLEREGLSNIEDEASILDRQSQEEIDANREMDRLERRARGQQRIQTAVSGISSATIAISGLTGAFKAYGDAAGDVEKQNDAIVAGTNSMGMSLMMLPGPWFKLAGAVTMAGGQLYKFIKENTGMGKVIKDNKKDLEDYKNKITELSNVQKGLNEAMSKMKGLEAIEKGGVTNAELEEYKTLTKEIAELRPEVVDYYDAYGNAVLKTRKEIEAMNEAIEEQKKVQHKAMEGKASNFATEMAYLTTNGIKEKEKIQAEIDSLTSEIDEMYIEGASQKSIDKKQDKLDEHYAQMETLQKRYDELGVTAQESLVTPFIEANDVFKKVGKDFQGYTTALFNPEKVLEGMDELARKGIKDTDVLRGVAEDYIAEYKQGVLEVADTFAMIETSSDKATIKLREKLKKLPEETKRGIGEIALEMSPFMNEEQLMKAVSDMTSYINEQGKLDAFGLIDYFKRVGEEAREAIEKGVQEASDSLKETMGSVVEGSTKSNITQLREEFNYSGTDPEKAEEIKHALDEYKKGNVEIFEKLYTTDAEIKSIIDLQIQDLISPEWSSAAEEAAGTQLRAALDALMEQKEAQDAINESFGETNILVDNYASKLAQTAEGQQFIVDMWNEMVGITEEVGEEGLFSVDLIALEEQADELERSSENADVLAENLKKAGVDSKTLEGHAKNIGEAFEDVLSNKEMSSTFQKLTGMSDEAMNNIRNLAQEAKKGNIDAAQSLQSEMGKIYGTLYAQDSNYFKQFVKNNRDRLNDVALVTGLEAGEYANLADYQNALQGWITQVGGQENFQRLVDQQSYLSEQVKALDSAGIAAVEINGRTMSSADRAAGISALSVARASVIAAQKGGEGGSEAAANMISALAAADDAVGTSLAGMAEQLRAKGDNYDSIVEMINAEIAKIAAGGEGDADNISTTPPLNWKPKPINYKPPGGNISSPSAPPPPKPSQGTEGPGVGSGGKDKDKGGKKEKKEKEVEDLEWEEDIYHDINIQLEKKGQLLDRLKKQQDKLYGKELLDNLAKQKQALQDQQKLLEKKLELQKKDLENQKKDLSKQGVKFNVDGTIANYNELLKQKLKYVNSLSGEAKEAAKEEFQALVEMMEGYEDLIMNSINETENAIQDSIDAQREIFLQEFDYKITIQLELTGDYEDALDFQKDFFDKFEDSDANYLRTIDLYNNKLGEMQAIQEQINKVNSDTTLSDKERIERLEELSKQLKDSALDAKKLSEELTKIYEETLKEGLDTLKKHREEFKDLNDEIKHMQQMMKLLGLEDNYGALDEMYEAQYSNFQGQIGLLNKQKETLEAEKKALEAAGLKGSDEWKVLNEAVKDTQKELDKLAQDTLKVLKDEFQNSINSIMEDLTNAISGGLGMDELKKQYDEMKKDRKEYLDIEEKITEVGKLQSKINKDLIGVTDPKKLEKLQKFKEKELAALKEKDKLTKYDVDRANLLYDITLKQMALEDQKNAKNLMRLVRDASGNWVYEFVEDAEAVTKARDELSKDLEKLQEMDKKQFEKAQEDMIKAKLDYEKEIGDIIKRQMNGEYATDEEFKKALENAQNKYNDIMKEKSEALNQAQVNGVHSSLATILLAYQENSEGLGILAGEQEVMMKDLATAIGGDFSQLSELMKALNSGNEEDFKNMAANMGLDGDLLKETLHSITGEIKDDWGGNLTDMIGSTDNFEESGTKTIDEIMKAWEEYKKKVGETTTSTGNDLESLKDRLEEVGDKTNELNKDTDGLIDTFDREMEQMSQVVKANAQLKASYDKITESIAKQIKELDELIRKQKEAATGVNKPGGSTKPPSTGGGSSGGGGSKPPSTGGGSKPPTKPPSSGGGNKTPSYTKGEFVTVTKNTNYYETSKGQKRKGPAYAGTKYMIDDPKTYKPMSGASHQIHLSNSKGGDLGWVKKSELKKFKSGGYTGAFSNDVIDGKLAILHEKELVLNKDDTKNMLNAVKMLRGTGKQSLAELFTGVVVKSTQAIVSSIDRLGSKMGVPVSSTWTPIKDERDLQQTVSINADFSGVRDSEEIKRAFDSLHVQASQYASKRK